MKIRKVLLVFFICMVSCNSKNFDKEIKLIPYLKENYWGYMDKDGNIKIVPQFKEAYVFCDELALVKGSNDLFGYIDVQGKLVIPTIYKYATGFNEGVASVTKVNSTIEYINKKGETLFKLNSEVVSAKKFNEEVAVVTIEKDEKLRNREYYIDKKGKQLFYHDYQWISNFSEGLALFEERSNFKSSYGYLNKHGKIIIRPQFEGARLFKDDMAIIEVGKKFGYIDRTGKIVINPIFDNCSNYSCDIAAVRQGQFWGFINKKGEIIINPLYENTKEFTPKGLCAVKSASNKKWGFINREGKYVIEPQFDYVTNFYGNSSIVKINEKWGIIDIKGKYLTNPTIDDINLSEEKDYEVYNDYYDNSKLSSLIFKNINQTEFKGLYRGITFKEIKYDNPSLTFLNAENFKDFKKESNGYFILSNVKYYFENDFINSSNNEFYNNENVKLSMALFSYTFLTNSKSSDSFKEIIKVIPKNFEIVYSDEYKYLLKGENFYFFIFRHKESKDSINLILVLDYKFIDELKNIK